MQQQPPQFNQPPNLPPVYFVQPPPQKPTNAVMKALAIMMFSGSAMVFIFGLCTLLLHGLGILFIIIAIGMAIGGLVALSNS